MDGFAQNYPSAPSGSSSSASNIVMTPQQSLPTHGAAQEPEDTRKGSKRRKAVLIINSIKREIGHLCHDERRSKTTEKQPVSAGASSSTFNGNVSFSPAGAASQQTQWGKTPYFYQPETLGNEFSVLTDFLETLDDGSFFTGPPQQTSSLMSASAGFSRFGPAPPTFPSPPSEPSASGARESGSRDERLNRVIRSKYEAGLLKPYNYVKGYARLSRWMDRNVSQESKQQILQPLSVLRPKFRAVAQSLRDIDLVFIEEAFERMLLDYDRVFSAMGVPACLWRRTGEIYKSNREFSELVGVRGEDMREGRLCIYELMAEESAVNYWEKYGHVAFDSSQKAVLTSCVLRYKPVLPSSNALPNAASEVAKAATAEQPRPDEQEEGEFINCCFSFTIRRDKYEHLEGTSDTGAIMRPLSLLFCDSAIARNVLAEVPTCVEFVDTTMRPPRGRTVAHLQNNRGPIDFLLEKFPRDADGLYGVCNPRGAPMSQFIPSLVIVGYPNESSPAAVDQTISMPR
ncbi:hypothetical protein MSAN_02250700 [Mycena sanguinolenta]|uniref:ERT1/acuK family PAS domain-containing protein n=1 Tax=Mycena sanguinolenta TaxID=230812 RepID=A0A8H6XBN4_9AGAR|nr:hypothetical protein MSAN_02250700 [Mycena sanguinolenta]